MPSPMRPSRLGNGRRHESLHLVRTRDSASFQLRLISTPGATRHLPLSTSLSALFDILCALFVRTSSLIRHEL
jgi:hypothetical protein